VGLEAGRILLSLQGRLSVHLISPVNFKKQNVRPITVNNITIILRFVNRKITGRVILRWESHISFKNKNLK
jgi:hypothetical protein